MIRHILPGKLTWPWKIPMFPGKYHQNGGFSMAMLVSGRVMNYERFVQK